VTSGSVLVTGASSGIGEACALAFDKLGWEVFAGIRREVDGKNLREKASARLRPVHVDVRDLASIDAAVKEIGERVGESGLTAVVNNAGIGIGGPVEYLSIDEWRRQFDVNVIGQVAVTKAVLPLIRKSKERGRILFIGSIGGRVASPFIAPYAALSATAGKLADRFEKPRLIQIYKAMEVGLMVLAALAFLSGSVVALLAVLVGLGVLLVEWWYFQRRPGGVPS